VTIDAGLVASVDLYTAGTNPLNVSEHTGLALAEGIHTLKFKVNGKNAGSSNHYCSLDFIVLERTA
jgi:hypothetical protein